MISSSTEPIISICIPTYNRAETLQSSLIQYTKCIGFDEQVEIVISDNCSTDNTKEIAMKFAAEYKNIKYYRNEENIRDSNFELALKRGNGRYLKLQNDATLFDINAFVYLKKCILESDERYPIFFTNDFIYTQKKGEQIIECNSFNEYISALSTYVTNIACFGVWKKQINTIKDFTKYTMYMLNQDDWSYQLVEKYGKCILYNCYYYSIIPKKRFGYHWFKVHLDNYYLIMEPYIKKGLVSKEVLKQDKKYLLKHFIPELKYIYLFPISGWKFGKKGTFRYLWKYYKTEWYFYFLILIYPFAFLLITPIHYVKLLINRIIKKNNRVRTKSTY